MNINNPQDSHENLRFPLQNLRTRRTKPASASSNTATAPMCPTSEGPARRGPRPARTNADGSKGSAPGYHQQPEPTAPRTERWLGAQRPRPQQQPLRHEQICPELRKGDLVVSPHSSDHSRCHRTHSVCKTQEHSCFHTQCDSKKGKQRCATFSSLHMT